MPSNSLLPERVDLTYRTQPADLPELMDGPCTYEDFRDCLRSLGQLNRLSLAYRPTLDFLNRITQLHRGTGPLRIVDVGSGGGDMLRRIARWARAHHIAVTLTGIDLNPYAARVCQEHGEERGQERGQERDEERSQDAAITWITGDAFHYEGPIDIVISSLFTHHLADAEIVGLLAWMERRARLGWFVNDLARAETPYRWIGAIAKGMRWHRFVQHDGPVSFRRALREDDWQRLLDAAEIHGAETQRWTPARLCVSRYQQ